VWRSTFEIFDTYAPIKAIGKGAYGVVVSATYKGPAPAAGRTGPAPNEKVAIKKIGQLAGCGGACVCVC
jgi:mitogen-activated protein kinase 1/3